MTRHFSKAKRREGRSLQSVLPWKSGCTEPVASAQVRHRGERERGCTLWPCAASERPRSRDAGWRRGPGIEIDKSANYAPICMQHALMTAQQFFFRTARKRIFCQEFSKKLKGEFEVRCEPILGAIWGIIDCENSALCVKTRAEVWP